MKKFLWTICSISYLFISPTSFAGKIEEAEINGFMAWAQKNKSTEWRNLGNIHPAFKVARLAAEEANAIDRKLADQRKPAVAAQRKRDATELAELESAYVKACGTTPSVDTLKREIARLEDIYKEMDKLRKQRTELDQDRQKIPVAQKVNTWAEAEKKQLMAEKDSVRGRIRTLKQKEESSRLGADEGILLAQLQEKSSKISDIETAEKIFAKFTTFAAMTARLQEAEERISELDAAIAAMKAEYEKIWDVKTELTHLINEDGKLRALRNHLLQKSNEFQHKYSPQSSAVQRVKLMRIISSALRGIGFGGVSTEIQASPLERASAETAAKVFGSLTTQDSGTFSEVAGNGVEAAHFAQVDQLVQSARHEEPEWASAEAAQTKYKRGYAYGNRNDVPLSQLMTFHFHKNKEGRQASTSILMRCDSWAHIPELLEVDDFSHVYFLSDFSKTISGKGQFGEYAGFTTQMGSFSMDGNAVSWDDEDGQPSLMSTMTDRRENIVAKDMQSVRVARDADEKLEAVTLIENEIPFVIDNVVQLGGTFGFVTFQNVEDKAPTQNPDRSYYYEAFPEVISGRNLASRAGMWDRRIGHTFAHYDGHGIIVTSSDKGHSEEPKHKGQFLSSFVTEHGGLPGAELVVFIDDTLEEDIGVYERLKDLDIPVISCFYADYMTFPEAAATYYKVPYFVKSQRPAAGPVTASTDMGSGAGSIGRWPASRRHSVTTPLKPPFAR